MIVLVARQPNIEYGLQDQTNIALNLFNTILDVNVLNLHRIDIAKQ